MEMALRPQGPLCPRSRPAFIVRPAGRGGGLAQHFLMTGRFTGSRIVRYMVASSDRPNRKSRGIIYPQIKVTASRGYAPRLTAESSNKNREHNNSDEETISTYNRLLSTDAAEWTGSRDAEIAEVDSSQNVSSSSTMGELNAVDEDIFGVELPGNALSSVEMGEVDAVDEAGIEEDIFEIDLSGTALSSAAMGKVDAVDEAKIEDDIFMLDLSGTALNSVAIGEVDVIDEARIEEDIFEADLSGTALSSAAMEPLVAVDEAGAEEDIFKVDSSDALTSATMREVDVEEEAWPVQDTFEVDLPGSVSSSSTMGKVDVVDEACTVQDAFEADLSGNVLSSATYREVAEEVIFEMALSENASSTTRIWEVDEARAEEETFEMDLLGSVSGSAKHMAVDFLGEAIPEEETYQEQYLALSSTSMEGKAIDKTHVSLKSELMPVVRVQEQDKSIFSVPEQAGSTVTFHKQNQPIEIFHERQQKIIPFAKQNQPIAGLPKQDQFYAVFPKQNQSIVSSNKQDQSIVVLSEQNQSIIGSYKQNESIVDVPEQIQSIVSSSKPPQSMVASCKQDQSIVSVTEQKQSILGFHLQDLSVVGFHEQNLSIIGSHKQDKSIVDAHKQIQSIVSSSKPHQSIVASCKQDQSIVSVPEQKQSILSFHKQDLSVVGFHEQNLSIIGSHKQDKSIVDLPKQIESIVSSSKPQQSMVASCKQDQSIVSVPEQKQSIVGFHKQDLSIVGFHEQNLSIIGSHKQDKSIVDLPKQIQSIVSSSKPQQSMVASCKQDQSIVCVPEQKQSIVGFHKQDLSVIGFHEQNLSIIGSHKQDKSIVDVPKHIQSIVSSSKQHQSIVASCKQDQSIVSVPEQKQSIVGFHKQDLSVVGFHEQNLSIIGSHKQDKSIVDVPEQIQSIVGITKQQQSIIASRKQDQSIVSVPEQKQTIVGFHKQDISVVGCHEQDLSIVGTSGEGQIKQMSIVRRHDALHVKGVEANDGDYTSQKTDGDTLHVKFDVDNLLPKNKADSAKEALEMINRKKVDEEHLSITEEQISAAEEQRMVSEDMLSMTEVRMGIGDELQHVISKELSWAEDEVGLIENDEQYEVDETSTSAEAYIQESPQDNVDPQALRRMLQELADKNYSTGNKLFVFPEVVKADSAIDLYLNRDLSALASEPDVLIKGAFNGWRWRLFTERLHKSELGGDWWHCKLYIPKQAYRLDFVFFNGRSVYENNGNNDFVIQIESIMDEDMFEDFLVEEKQRELERLAVEEAEKRREAEEQRRGEKERAEDEAVRAQVKAEVEMKKNKLHNLLGFARTCADNLWYIESSTNRRGDTIRLYYNRSSRPVAHSAEIWMHGGYNNWTDGLSIVERLVECDDKDGDWWYADVFLPEKAFVLDWVFADGPPGNARNYDNNGRQDFHAILPNIMTEEDYWVGEEQSIYTRLLHERREREEAIQRKAERSAKMKAEMKAKTMRRFLLSQKHIVYTEPLEIRAGTTVDVLYNPSNTVLNGKPEVWFRCSFNLWMHPGGVLPPQKMVKSQDGSLLKATVSVPPDAYMMDFVFSESEEGGIYDNRNGMDYHIPVSGSIAKETPMHIVHIAVEMAPVAKVGGLGDVVTSLSRAVQDLGHTIEVILPKYDCLNLSNVKNLHLYQSFPWGGTEIKVWFGLVEDLSVYFLEPQNGMFGVGCVYGRNDDRRFGFFCHSALEFILQNESSPHIIHCHDWSSAPVAWLYKEHYAQSRLTARVVFTIHNLEFGAHYIGKAMTYCDKATTVSHTYSREVASHGAIAPHHGKFYGILNGIDPDIWDPYSDNFIPVNYTSENVIEGKNAAKKALQQKLGLQQTDVPIIGIVTRLTAQKGIHLIKHAIHRTLEGNGQVVLLGSAPDPRIQSDFCNLADTLHGVNHGRVRFCLTYDEPLSHLIYAGSDFILVPSIFEPCGLTQLVAMRYGSIPIVRRTGGLYDTVFDVDHDKDRARSLGLEPNGFSFEGADSNGVDYALNRAISAWFDARDCFHSLCKRVMEQDWSWNRPALDYLELYHSARKF